MLYIGLGVILGHNYPFYLHFKGGKGIAATVGIVFSTYIFMVPISAVLFFATVIPTGFISIGSLMIVSFFRFPGGFCDPSGMEYLHGKMRSLQFKRYFFYRI